MDPKFRHGAEGVTYKRVVEGAEIANVRARDRAPSGHGLRGNEPRSTVQICWTRRHPVPRGSPPKAVEGMGAGGERSRLKWRR